MDAVPFRRLHSHRWRPLTEGEIAMARCCFAMPSTTGACASTAAATCPFSRRTARFYELRQGATLVDYNMEAQGDLLADYFMLKHRRQPEAMRQQHYRDSLALYESVLSGFLAAPGSRANLHRGLARRLVRAPV